MLEYYHDCDVIHHTKIIKSKQITTDRGNILERNYDVIHHTKIIKSKQITTYFQQVQIL